MNIACGATPVIAKASVRYLGVDLDQTLDGKSIVENILKKGNLRLKFLWRQAKCLNRNSRKLLATSLIQCHFDYACSSWFEGLQIKFQQKLQILQNKTIRFVLGYPPRSHIGLEEFTLLNWIPVNLRVKQIKLNNMFRVVHGNAPSYMGRGVVMVHQQHSFFTRSSIQSIVLPHVNSAGTKSFKYSAGKAWNALPVALRECTNFSNFKRGVKKHLQDEMEMNYRSVFLNY